MLGWLMNNVQHYLNLCNAIYENMFCDIKNYGILCVQCSSACYVGFHKIFYNV